MSRACILLLNWNGWGDTIECLESIFRSVPSDVRVIVCDNASSDGSVEKIEAWAKGQLDVRVPVDHPLRETSWPPVLKPIPFQICERLDAEKEGKCDSHARLVLIRTGGNFGFAGGNNVGLRYVLKNGQEDNVWLLNNDTVIVPGALDALLKRMGEDPAIGMCGSTLLRYHEPLRVQARGGGWYCKWIGLPWHLGQLGRADDPVDELWVERWMNYVVGASLCVSRTFLEQIGLMCEDYFLFFEETDWAVRSKGQFRLAYAAPREKSLTCDFFALRNRLKFSQRYYPFALPTIYIGLMLSLLIRCLSGRWNLAGMVLDIMRGCDEKWEIEILSSEGPSEYLGADVKVSIITVCLNAVEYIDQTLKSILSQDYRNIECIVIDGGSTDGTLEIIEKMAEKDDRIHWQTGSDSGISDAMNRGVESATGEIVAHLHADDFYATNSVLSTVVGEFDRQPEAIWVTGGIREIDESGCSIRNIPVRRYSAHRLLRNNVILHPATLVRRSAFDSVGGFDTGLKYAMDYDLWLRLAKVGAPVVIDQILTCFRVHSGSLSSVNRISAFEEEYQVRKRFLSGPVERFLHYLYQAGRKACEIRSTGRTVRN